MMGLDTVELVMAFEEAFDTPIPDDEAERMVTVRDVIDYFYARLPHGDISHCLTQRAFHRLRRAVRDTTGVARARIRPTTGWETLMPLEHRRETWSRLGQALGLDRWPELQRSRELTLLIALACLTIAATSFAVAPSYNVEIALAAAIGSAFVLTWATRPWRVVFARDKATVGKLAEFLVARSPAALKSANEGWTRDQVRVVVRRIAVEHLSVDPTFSDDARFVDDLGAD